MAEKKSLFKIFLPFFVGKWGEANKENRLAKNAFYVP